MAEKCRGWTDEQLEQVQNNIIPDGKNYHQCAYVCRRYLDRGFSPVRSKQVFEDTRGKEYHELHKAGKTYAAIAKKEGISRQRVCSIVQRWESRNTME